MRPTSLVQIGDVHFLEDRQQPDREAALDQIIDEAVKLPRLGAWLLPGDLFHARSSIAVRNALIDRVERMVAHAPVIACDGNHDVPGDLHCLRKIHDKYRVHLVSTPMTLDVELATKQPATFFILPYPHPAGLVARGVPQQEVGQKAAEALDVLFMHAAHVFETARARGRLVAMIGHANVVGTLMGTGQPQIGAEIALDWTMLARLGDCYKGLNHIHIAQDVGGATFAGSSCRLSWGEVEPKSYVVVHYAEDGSYSVDRRPVNVAPMWHLTSTLTRNGFTDIATSDGVSGIVLAAMSFAGCDVRLRATYKQSEGVVLTTAAAQAKALFPNARRFEFEPVCVPDRAVRAPEVVREKTLAGKIAAWATVAGVTLPVSAVAKLARLETSDPDLLIAAVQQELQDQPHEKRT